MTYAQYGSYLPVRGYNLYCRVGSQVSSEDIMAMHANGTMVRNFNGIFKDTAFVPDGGYTVVRFLADNPGVWLFHCHLIFHSEIGEYKIA